jgi:cytochrome c-type biogenesis protein CcmH/NrfG
MNKESFALGIAGVFFGLLVGWVLGSQSARRLPDPAAPVAAAAPAGQPGTSPAQQPAPQLDQARVEALRKQADANPKDAVARAELGNAYFDAERYADAIQWYEASLAISPNNPDVSTDLGVSYYYSNQADRALAQFDKSLAINPKHTKTMLNVGVVRAFGKQDLAGAAAIWQQVIVLAPDSAEGRAAKQMIDALKSAHPEAAPGQPAPAATAPATGGGA